MFILFDMNVANITILKKKKKKKKKKSSSVLKKCHIENKGEAGYVSPTVF